MLTDTKTDSMRFTKAELAMIRESAARNGYRIEQIKNHGEAMAALMKSLHRSVIDDMQEFFETGKSPLIMCATVEEFEKRLRHVTAES